MNCGDVKYWRGIVLLWVLMEVEDDGKRVIWRAGALVVVLMP